MDEKGNPNFRTVVIVGSGGSLAPRIWGFRKEDRKRNIQIIFLSMHRTHAFITCGLYIF